jgi:kynurenine formamidase
VRDLTQPVETGMQVYPGDPPVRVREHATHAGEGYRVRALELGTHTGTHVDAPAHTEPDGATLDAFPVDRFRFDARLVDCTGVGARTAVEPAHLPDDPAGDLLVLRTGWDAHWGSERALDHPFLSRAAAEHCVARGWDVATDALSVDETGGGRVPAHHALLGGGRLIVENLTNLAGLPSRFELLALPLRLDADGAPVRAVALRD